MQRIFILLLLALLLRPVPAFAETVYKTVEGGVPTFSDTPPAQGPAEVLTLQVPEASQDGLLEERLAAMRETTDRMAADRREREKHRAELRSMQVANAPSTAPREPAMAWTEPYGFWPAYGRPLRPRPPYLPGNPGPRPLPAAEPPPGWSVMQPGNSQLMRPIVSSRP